jgi:CMP-N,N'-diacetyllegionaminic acid synthase
MYKGKTFLAVIPARGGSKGIPRKNIVTVNKKPLIQYTIDEAKGSKYLDKIIVSTDDKEIAQIAKKCGAEVPFLRPKYLASDEAKTIEALIHVIVKLRSRGSEYDYLILLQPTQPLRKSWHIDEAIEKVVEEAVDSLVSVTKVKEHPILMRSIDGNGKVKNLLDLNSTIRRQDHPNYYKVNGAIYINRIDENLSKDTSLNDNKLAYIMDREFDLDLDDPIDLELFKHKISQHYGTDRE